MTRLDKALVDRGLARSRAEAHELIDSGKVRVEGQPAAKSSRPVTDQDAVEIIGETCPYVSRGGIKLAAALDAFALDPSELTALDVGASTGGFTDCLLQRGALRVVAIDVGHGQIHPRIAADPRVEIHEGINARDLRPDDFPTLFDIVTADLSFISLTLVLPAIAPLLERRGSMVCLVKPQFEAGLERVGKGGIVRDTAVREAAVTNVIECAKRCGLTTAGRIRSPILGTGGNAEFLLHLGRKEEIGV